MIVRFGFVAMSALPELTYMLRTMTHATSSTPDDREAEAVLSRLERVA